MGTSAALIGIGLILIVAQIAFSDGARPNVIGLPIGMIPVTLGSILLFIGVIWGLVRGSPRFRGAAGLGLLGTVLVMFGLTIITRGGQSSPSISEISLLAGVALWIAAIVQMIRALRQPVDPRLPGDAQ